MQSKYLPNFVISPACSLIFTNLVNLWDIPIQIIKLCHEQLHMPGTPAVLAYMWFAHPSLCHHHCYYSPPPSVAYKRTALHPSSLPLSVLLCLPLLCLHGSAPICLPLPLPQVLILSPNKLPLYQVWDLAWFLRGIPWHGQPGSPHPLLYLGDWGSRVEFRARYQDPYLFLKQQLLFLKAKQNSVFLFNPS